MSAAHYGESASRVEGLSFSSNALLPSARASFVGDTTFSTDSELASVESTNTVSLIGELLARLELDGQREPVLANAFLRALLLRCACSFAFRSGGTADGSQTQLAELISTQQYPRYVSRAQVRQTEASLHAVLQERASALAPSIAEALTYLSPANSTSISSASTTHRAVRPSRTVCVPCLRARRPHA